MSCHALFLIAVVSARTCIAATFMDSDETGLGNLLRSKPPGRESFPAFGVVDHDGIQQRSLGQPFFPQNEVEVNPVQPVTAQLGTEIALNCTVENLDDKTVLNALLQVLFQVL